MIRVVWASHTEALHQKLYHKISRFNNNNISFRAVLLVVYVCVLLFSSSLTLTKTDADSKFKYHQEIEVCDSEYHSNNSQVRSHYCSVSGTESPVLETQPLSTHRSLCQFKQSQPDHNLNDCEERNTITSRMTSTVAEHQALNSVEGDVFCSQLPEHMSVHAAHITEVHNVPMKVLIRPIPSVLDEVKVSSLMETIQNPETVDKVPPIDILWVKGREGGDYYYSFGGCHRYEAYKRLKRETIPCKIFKSTVDDLKSYLGGSTPDLL
ncbi:unnamed protein product [Candidula unifasciata]|uniref:sulfiredoxin n=1 Tax=Candidula unifasciata TaxID=100452 RepID=A0A8S3ZXM1_9EUPU|nr:unnamed protein product [Candidula unifasciata]